MTILEKVYYNLLGASYENQKKIINTLINSLCEGKGKKVSRELRDLFDGYFESVDDLLNFKNLYQTFNSTQKRVSRRFTLKELMESVKDHHINNSDLRITQYFIYSSEEITDFAKKQEYMSFFKPQRVLDEEVKEFLTAYESLDEEKKVDYVDDITILYDRIRYFAFFRSIRVPIENSLLDQYRPIIESLIGIDMMTYYDSLYPKEQLSLIDNIVRMCHSLSDKEYLARKKEEMNGDPEYIRKLKKEAKSTCQFYRELEDLSEQ